MELKRPVFNWYVRWLGSVVGLSFLVVALSCRQQKESEGRRVVSGTGGTAGRVQEEKARVLTDAELEVRVAELHEAERRWIRDDATAADAFRKLEEARAAYFNSLTPFGPYAAAARDRDQAVQKLLEAREQGSDELIRVAEENVLAANKKLDETEEWIRLGNPRVRKAFEEWQEARARYSALRSGQSDLVKKAAAVRERTVGPNSEEQATTEGAKEN